MRPARDQQPGITAKIQFALEYNAVQKDDGFRLRRHPGRKARAEFVRQVPCDVVKVRADLCRGEMLPRNDVFVGPAVNM
jgi:hypothetical protein